MNKTLFEKIEFQINRFIYWLIDIFFLTFKKLFPPSFKKSLKEKFKPITNRYEVLHHKFDQNIKWISLKIDKTKDVDKSLNFSERKEKLKKLKNKVFSNWYTDKIKRIFSERIERFKKVMLRKFENFNQYHLLGLTIVFLVSGIASIKIYNSTYSIVSKEYKHKDRKIASAGYQQQELFPDYLDYEKRLSIISQLVMPAFIEDTGKYQNLKINFAIQFTNRSSKRFFDRYRHLFMDQLQVTLEPVLPSFPLTREGKDIVRKKLFEELNDVLMNESIDGRVKEITIIDIIAN